jgi:hypothetical protein
MKRVAILLSVIVFITFSFTGCEWAGRTAGKAEKGMQKGAEKMDKGIQTGGEKMDKGAKKLEKDFDKGYEEGNK